MTIKLSTRKGGAGLGWAWAGSLGTDKSRLAALYVDLRAAVLSSTSSCAQAAYFRAMTPASYDALVAERMEDNAAAWGKVRAFSRLLPEQLRCLAAAEDLMSASLMGDEVAEQINTVAA